MTDLKNSINNRKKEKKGSEGHGRNPALPPSGPGHVPRDSGYTGLKK